MNSITIISSEFGDVPHACAHRFNGLVKSLVLDDKNELININVLSGIGYSDIKSPNLTVKTCNLNCRTGSFLSRILKEIIYAFFCIFNIIRLRRTLVIISIPNFISSILIIFICRMLHIKYIIDIRDLYPDAYSLSRILNKNSWIYKVLLWLTIRQYKKASLIVTVTRGLGKILMDRGIQENKIKYVLNGYPSSLCKSIKDSQLNKDKDIVFHGTIGLMQDSTLIMNLLEQLPQYNFSFIGSGPVFDRIENLKLKNVSVYNRMNLRETLELVSTHKIGLCIRSGSWYDSVSLPVKIYEYLGLGLHVISYPITEFSMMYNKIPSLHEFNEPNIEKILEQITHIMNLDDPPENAPIELSREYNSDIFKNIVKEEILISNY